MKKNFLLYSLLSCLVLFTFSACEKDEFSSDSGDISADTAPQINADVSTSEDFLFAETLFESTEAVEEVVIDNLRSGDTISCRTISVMPADGSFPRTVTIDFGEGCEGPDSTFRSGKIIVRQTDSLHLEGAQRITTFDNFFVDSVQVTGSKTLTNLGTNDNGRPVVNRKVENAQLIFVDGKTVKWSSDYTRTQIKGVASKRKIDDTFAITGQSEGVNRRGVEYSTIIIEPLIRSNDCRWIQAGVQQITRNERTWTIDYGKGFCDRLARVLLPNGKERVIRL